MRYLETKISENIGRDSLGQLICQNCIIARDGEQRYLRSELPGWDPKTMTDEVVIINRPWEEVSKPEAVASFEAKPVVVRHPSEDVTINNYKQVAVGYVKDVVPGAEKVDGHNVLLATLVIYDPDTIQAIESGRLRSLSCGYDVDVDMERKVQYNIEGNHVAIVDSGRGGITTIRDEEAKVLPGFNITAEEALVLSKVFKRFTAYDSVPEPPQRNSIIVIPGMDVYEFNDPKELDEILKKPEVTGIVAFNQNGESVEDVSELSEEYIKVLDDHGYIGTDDDQIPNESLNTIEDSDLESNTWRFVVHYASGERKHLVVYTIFFGLDNINRFNELLIAESSSDLEVYARIMNYEGTKEVSLTSLPEPLQNVIAEFWKKGIEDEDEV